MKTNEVILELMVNDVWETVSFYKDALNFELLAFEEDEGKLYWAKMRLGSFNLSFKEESRVKREVDFMRDKLLGGSISICVVVDEIIKLHADIEKKFKLLDHPHLTPCGATQFSLKDNNGYIVTFEKF